MSESMMIAGFDHTEEAEVALDLVDSVADRQHRHIPVLGVISAGDAATTTTTISDPTKPGSGLSGTLLRILVDLSRATPSVPRVGGVVWGIASGIGRDGLDNPAMWALARGINSRRHMLVSLADAETIAEVNRQASVPSTEVHDVPKATSSLVSLMAGLSMHDLTRRPVSGQ